MSGGIQMVDFRAQNNTFYEILLHWNCDLIMSRLRSTCFSALKKGSKTRNYINRGKFWGRIFPVQSDCFDPVMSLEIWQWFTTLQLTWLQL